MQFQILGPLEVHGEQGPVALGGAKPRAVLAVLLLHANEPVSAERLALALWGEDAPGGAVKTVQVHVSRLRKALGDPDVIATTPAGYCLRVRADELDAERFEQLVEAGRQALGDQQPEHAATLLREALALWRGDPLGELALEPFAQSETARLEEGRLSAIETRIDADLAAGHGDLIGELQRLAAEHPLREHIAGQLMLALYRCGRQTEALEVYRATRGVLTSEIGVEPGPELRRLQEAILRQDASLEPEANVDELPRELDAAASPPLLGRDSELDWLDDRWERARTGAGALVGLAGARGSGKTRLAAQLAGRVHATQAAVIFASGSGSPAALAGALRRARETSRATLLVIDDADRAELGALDGLRELTAVGGLLVLITGEDARALERLGAPAVLELAPLEAEAAVAIAMLYAPGRDAGDVPAQWLVDSSDGVARRLHELASQWARREAARRVGAVAGRAAAGREQLRSIQDELTGDVEELQAAHERLARAGEDDSRVVCPFKGLASFDVADAPYFFGRERLVAELVARLVGAPLLGIVGPSGSGKSSVTRAGLLPALASGVLPGSHEWAQVLIRPGEHPLRELTDALARVGDAERVVIAVDQFEETFTNCEDEDERAGFIAELGAAAADRAGRYVVVMALRADFYGRCAAYPELGGPLAANHVLVGSMRRDELRRAIERPAERVGLRVDPELADALVADVRDEPGALPLLQTALLELWQRRDGRRLRYSAYEQSGGVRGAVARLAEDAFGALDAGQQLLARGVLMRLASEGEAGAVERRRIPLAELETERSEELARAVALLTDRRLLTASAGSIELAHEALLREWPRLRDWVAENREGLRVQRNLAAAAREWKQLGRDEGALYRGTRLIEALEWAAADNPQSLNEVERAFLGASDAARQRERAQRRRRIVAAFAGLTTVLVAVAIVAIIAVTQGREAERQRDVAASRELAARAASLTGSDPRLSLAVALAALQRRDTEQAQSAVRQATLADRTVAIAPAEGYLYGVAASRDGQRVVTAGDEPSLVRVWNVASGKLETTIKGHEPSALAASFSPDGAQVASVGDDGDVVIADARGGARRVLFHFPKPEDNYPRSVEYSPDGKRLLVATSTGQVGIIPTQSKPARLRLLGSHTDRTKASFNDDGTKVVSASEDGSARIWNVASGTSIVLPHPVPVHNAAFSPDGRLVATAGDDGFVRFWKGAGGAPAGEIEVDQDSIGSVRFSPDSRRVVTAGIDGVARVFVVGGGPPLSELTGRAGSLTDAAFVPGTNKVVTVGEEGTLRIWTAPAVDQLIAGGRAPYKQPSVSPGARKVVSGYDSGEVRVWDYATGKETNLPAHDSPSEAKFSADGTHIVTASLVSGAVRLWDVERRRSRLVESEVGDKFAVAVAPAGRRVAVATLDKETVVQAPDGRQRVVLRGHEEDVLALEFSHDGKHVVSAGEDDTVRLWRAGDGRQERVLQAGGNVVDVAYSRDGRRVAAAGVDGTVRIWSVAGGDPVLLYGHDGAVNTVAFNPRGDQVVSAGKDGTVRVWNAAGGVSLVTVEAYRGDAPGAVFSADGKSIVSAGERERVLRISACEVCGPFADVQVLARARPVRTLDSAERQRLLSSGG